MYLLFRNNSSFFAYDPTRPRGEYFHLLGRGGFPIPDEMYFKIDKALGDRGCVGDMSIWAYVDDENNGSWSGDEYLRQKT